MIQNMIDKPWSVLAFVMVIALLNIGAILRGRHDMKVHRFAHGERRRLPRLLPGHWCTCRRKA